MKRSVANPATKARVLQRAAETSAAQAAREFDIPSATIRGWRARSQEPAPRSAEESRVQGDRQQVGADRMWEVAEAALRKALDAIERGDTLAAQRLMVSAGISADKTGQLEEAAARAAERHVRLGASQGQVVAEVIQAFADALGIPLGVPARKVLGDLLRQAGDGGVLVASPASAESARDGVRQHVARELAEESGAAALLPVGSEPVEEIDGQLTVDEVLEATESEEVTDAVVESDPLPAGWLQMNHGDEAAARKAYKQFLAEKVERERREREPRDGWRTGAAFGHGNEITALYQEPRGGPGGGV